MLNQLKKNKKISKIGITIYDTKNLNSIIKKFKIDFIQLPYNFLNYEVFNKTKKLIQRKKIEIHLRSIFFTRSVIKKKL